MECWPLSKHTSSIYWLVILMMMAIFMVRQIQGGCIEEERKALLEIKASFNSYVSDADRLLPTWVDHGSTAGGSGGECCDWERVMCNTTTWHVTELSLDNLRRKPVSWRYTWNQYQVQLQSNKLWPLNVSLFLHFEELRSLNLSWNFLDNGIVNTGLERLSSLKKLEILDLSSNYIEYGIFPSLSALTSLKILVLSDNDLEGYFPAHEFAALENLEMLDLTKCGLYGTFQMQGFERVSILRKLKTLNLGWNRFNESLITSLSALSSLKTLDLHANLLSGSFPAQELAHLTNLEKLDLSHTRLNRTSTVQGCKSLSRLKRVESIALGWNSFNKSIISCLSALPSLKILDLGFSLSLGNSFPIQELSGLTELKTLDLSGCGLDSLAFNGTMSRLVQLNLDGNGFGKDIMRLMGAFPSLKFLSLEACQMEGALFAEGLPNMPDLEILLLSENRFNGTLPMEALASFHHLKVLDLSWNSFVGTIPSAIRALSSLRVLSLALNKLNGSLPEHGLCELKNLHELDLSQNMFKGDLPQCFNSLLSLKLFDISSNQFTGIISPTLVTNLTSLEYIDFSHNKFEGSFSFSSFSNHTKLELVEFTSDSDKFEVETEEPFGWIPMFQLKVLVLSNCNMNRPTGSLVPSFLFHQHELHVLDLSHNSLEGQLPNWLIENNTMLDVLNLRNNSFGGSIHMPPYRNANMRWLDMSGNHIIGNIPGDTQKFLPCLAHLNLSRNALSGALPSSIGDLSELYELDLSDNDFSGEVPKGLLTNAYLLVLILSNNRLHGQILSGNFSLGTLRMLLLEGNCFTGEIGNETSKYPTLFTLDISNNLFSGVLPNWISNRTTFSPLTLVLRNNRFESQFPCGKTSFLFLDISQNSFSGSIPSCLNLQPIKHLHLGSNRFTGSIPQSFRNLTNVLTLDMGNNFLSGRIPEFLGELSNLRILLLRKNNFIGSIPKQLCQLSNMSLIDLSSNSLSGSIPRCLQNITRPSYLAFVQGTTLTGIGNFPSFEYRSVIRDNSPISYVYGMLETRDEVQFTTKSMYLPYKGNILDYMTGLDLSCNKLTGEIPEELGLLTQILALNLSHNQLTGPIPVQFSNLAKIESLDLSSNCLSGKVPSQLIKLNYLAVFIVAHNNLSGQLPEMKAQFSTFTKESYEGNPFLCGPPVEKKCTSNPPVTVPSAKKDTKKWYNIDMACFFGSFSSTWVVFLLGFAATLYTNPYWRRRWLDFIEECMYTCYYFFCDSVRKLSNLLYK